MEDNAQNTPERQTPDQGSGQLLFVLLIVLIICGGNGVGILVAGVIWKLTHMLAAAIMAAVAITLAAFIAAMIVLVQHNKRPR